MANFHAVIEALAGFSGTLLATAAVYPLDVVKTRVIVSDTRKGVLDTLFEMAVSEGVGSLYRGLVYELIKNGATSFLYVYVYEFLKSLKLKKDLDSSCKEVSSSSVPPQDPVLSLWSNLLIGVIAGSVTQCVVNPLNVVCTRMQAQSGSNMMGIVDTTRTIFSEGGFTALYRGLIPAFFLSLNPSIQYLLFDQLKHFRISQLSSKRIISNGEQSLSVNLSPWESFWLGGFAKTVATYVTYPLIVAKVRMQAGESNQDIPIAMLPIIYHIFKTEGFLALFKGVFAVIAKSVLQSALMFSIKEKIVIIFLLMEKFFYRANQKEQDKNIKFS